MLSKIYHGLQNSAQRNNLKVFIRQGLDNILGREIVGLCSVFGSIFKNKRPTIPDSVKKCLKSTFLLFVYLFIYFFNFGLFY